MKASKVGVGLILLPPLLFLSARLLYTAGAVTAITRMIPPCGINELTGLYCPGCGITRSIYCLLEGRIFYSFLYNPLPLILIVIGFGFYLELIFAAFGKKVRIMPRKLPIYIAIIVLAYAYYAARNFIPRIMPPHLDYILHLK